MQGSINTALVLRAACEDAFPSYGYYYYDPPAPERALARLGGFLPYFDELAEGLEDQASPTSRRLSQERALVAQLLSNIEDRWY